MLAATGFKPDMPNKTLAIVPGAPGDFRAPWVMASGFGTISSTGQTLSIHCAYGTLEFASPVSLNASRTSTLDRTAAISTGPYDDVTLSVFRVGIEIAQRRRPLGEHASCFSESPAPWRP
jgi:hypothetical protein